MQNLDVTTGKLWKQDADAPSALIAVFSPQIRSKIKFCEKVHVHCGRTFVLAVTKSCKEG